MAIIVNNNIVTFGLPTRTYSVKEQTFLTRLKGQTPLALLKNCNEANDLDMRLLAISLSALDDINNQGPSTSYTFDNLPNEFTTLLILGTQVWLLLFFQMKYSLIDLSYSDGGLSVNVDRVGKLTTVAKEVEQRYQKILDNKKKNMMLKNMASLTTPRFQSNLSRFIGILSGGSAAGWNVP